MNEKAKRKTIEYGSCFVLTAIAVVAFVLAQDPEEMTRMDWYRILSDAFTVPGMLMIFAGLMSWLASEGALNGVSYCLQTVGHYLLPGKRMEKRESYADYVARRSEKKRGGYGFLLISGAVAMVGSILFLALFYLEKG